MTAGLRDWLNLTAISTAALLTAGGGGAAAATITVGAPISNLVLADGDSLDNFSDIGGGFAVLEPGSAGTITNQSGASISGVFLAIEVDGNVGTLDNRGSLFGGGVAAVYVTGDIGTFINSDSITFTRFFGSGSNYAVYIGGHATSFANTGTITNTSLGIGVALGAGADDFSNSGYISGGTAVSSSGRIGKFTNTVTGTIESDGLALALQDVGTFDNEGSIRGDRTVQATAITTFINRGTIESGGTAVLALQDVQEFRNENEITASSGLAVEIDGHVGSFVNAAGATIWSDDTSYGGIEIGGGVDSFDNAGNIASHLAAVTIDGGVGNFTNNGMLKGGYDTGANAVVIIGAVTGTFTNAAGGTIDAHDTSGGTTNRGVVFGSSVNRFVNGGTIIGDGVGVEFGDTVTSFINQSGGTIEGSIGVVASSGLRDFVNAGTINGYSQGLLAFGDIDTFANAAGGTMSGSNGALLVYGTVRSFSNSGDLSGDDGAVNLLNHVGSFVNTGHIWDTMASPAVLFGGGVDSFYNAGTIDNDSGFGLAAVDATSFVNDSAGTISGDIMGLVLLGATQDFRNAGTISSADGNGVGLFGAVVGAFHNRGTISGSNAGISVDGSEVTLVNTGTISGGSGIVYNAGIPGSGAIVNSGTIRGTSGPAIDFGFLCGCAEVPRDDNLTILTGSKIFGVVNFGQGDDTFDFSGFAGNTVLDVPGLNIVVPGSRGYVWDQPNDKIAIFDLSGLGGAALGDDWNSIGQSMFAAARNEMADWSGLNPGGASGPLGYAPAAPETSAQQATETAVLTELDTTQHLGLHGWASVIGGGSGVQSPVDRNSAYAGLIAGTHARLNQMLTLGGMGGVVQSTSSSLDGDEVLNTTTGSLGLYGSAQFGVADIDVSLLAGLGLNQSSRKVVAGGTTETAVGNFMSAVLSPMLAVSIPVLSANTTTVSLDASGSYTGGVVAGYSETGSSMNLVVGSQTIAVLDARLGIATKSLISTSGGATYALTTKAGVFATSNFGSSSVPVTVFGQTTQLSTPGSTAYGVYTGLGAEAAITETLHLGAHLDGSWRSDGVIAAAAKFTLGGTF